MATNFLKVLDIQILTLATKDGVPNQRTRPILKFDLEKGKNHLMSGIPQDIALNLSMELNDVETDDSRLQIQDLVAELAIIEKVEIDMIVPKTDVYQATIYITPEGFERSLQLQMVPSHATLLAVLNDAPIFVSEELVQQAESRRS